MPPYLDSTIISETPCLFPYSQRRSLLLECSETCRPEGPNTLLSRCCYRRAAITAATAAARLPNNIHLFSTFSLKLWRKLCCFYNSSNTVLYVLHWPYLNGKIWKLSTHVYVFLRTERRNKYCKFEYFKIIQCKVLDHTLKQILYYCYTANCTNEKNQILWQGFLKICHSYKNVLVGKHFYTALVSSIYLYFSTK